MKNSKLVYCLTALIGICFINCENSIMKTWWEEPEPKEPEVEYIPIMKMVPQVTYDTVYETIIKTEYQTIHDTVFVELPPEVIYQTITETEYITLIEKVPEYIYVDVIVKEPEYIYETIIQYETVTETITETVYETVTITLPPTKEDIIQYIKDNPTEVIEIIKEDPNRKEILKEIIKEIPPNEIITYLTEEQIKYIIAQQPPQVILQKITIINIDYIIFSGDSRVYNGNSPATGGTSLTTQEKNTNDVTISSMAGALQLHPEYLIMLHGHANPVNFTDGETVELMQLSLDRAKSVETVLKDKFTSPPINGSLADWSDRVTVSGYGGEKNLFGSNSTYAGLNRRVEMILVRVGI